MRAPKGLSKNKNRFVKPKSWRKRGTGNIYDTRQWRADRALHLQAYPTCKHCDDKGFTTEARVSDHVIPINQGGDVWSWDNRQALCHSCHNRKTAKERRDEEGNTQ